MHKKHARHSLALSALVCALALAGCGGGGGDGAANAAGSSTGTGGTGTDTNTSTGTSENIGGGSAQSAGSTAGFWCIKTADNRNGWLVALDDGIVWGLYEKVAADATTTQCVVNIPSSFVNSTNAIGMYYGTVSANNNNVSGKIWDFYFPNTGDSSRDDMNFSGTLAAPATEQASVSGVLDTTTAFDWTYLANFTASSISSQIGRGGVAFFSGIGGQQDIFAQLASNGTFTLFPNTSRAGNTVACSLNGTHQPHAGTTGIYST